MLHQNDLSKIIRYLKVQDKTLARVIKNVPPPKIKLHRPYFNVLVMSIVSQQLSTKAADTIYKRVKNLCGGNITPMKLKNLKTEKLRNAGLSRAKVGFIKDLANKILIKHINLQSFKNESDEQILAELTSVKGIGLWTAEMFLMFACGRPDIFSYGDLGLRRGIEKIYKLTKPLTPIQAKKITNKWKPYRTVGCLYLWATQDKPGESW